MQTPSGKKLFCSQQWLPLLQRHLQLACAIAVAAAISLELPSFSLALSM